MKEQFSNKNISLATVEDIPVITTLLNNTYRGEASKKGWTTEADLIAGDTRTDETSLQEVIQREGSVMLKYTRDGALIGCVNLQLRGQKVYLGMFSVSPELQGGGIGKQLLQAAEEWARINNCDSIYMHVVSVRTELIEWYKRHGYIDTGKTEPFVEDGLTGKHLQPLEFMVMEKPVR